MKLWEINNQVEMLSKAQIQDLIDLLNLSLADKQPLSTVLSNTTASYTTAIDTRLANTTWTNSWNETALSINNIVKNSTALTSLDNDNYIPITPSIVWWVISYITWANFKTILNSLYQAVLVSWTNIKTVNWTSLLWSWNISISGGGSNTPIRITIPWEQIADISNYQWLYWYNNTWATITISNVAFAVWTNASWSWAACAYNLYKSSGTASNGLNTNAVALFTTAVDLTTNYTSLTNVPNTTTVENWRWITLRCTSSAWATNRASDMQCIINYF